LLIEKLKPKITMKEPEYKDLFIFRPGADKFVLIFILALKLMRQHNPNQILVNLRPRMLL
jgi:hypothetical protein